LGMWFFTPRLRSRVVARLGGCDRRWHAQSHAEGALTSSGRAKNPCRRPFADKSAGLSIAARVSGWYTTRSSTDETERFLKPPEDAHHTGSDSVPLNSRPSPPWHGLSSVNSRPNSIGREPTDSSAPTAARTRLNELGA